VGVTTVGVTVFQLVSMKLEHTFALTIYMYIIVIYSYIAKFEFLGQWSAIM